MFEKFKKIQEFENKIINSFPENKINFKEVINEENFIPYLNIFVDDKKSYELNLENFLDYTFCSSEEFNNFIKEVIKSVNKMS